MAADEVQGRPGDVRPTGVDGQRVSASGDLGDLGDARVLSLVSEGGLGDGRGMVVPFSPEMISSGPRSGLATSTLASVNGLRLASTSWKSGAPDAGTW